MPEKIFEGSLAAISVPDLVTFINLTKKTGTLTLQQDERTRRIYWERGETVFASSTDPEESLGPFLVRHGKITAEQNMQSGLQVQPGKRQGRVLVEMGLLTPKSLWWAVKSQVLEIIYTVFSVKEGRFYFDETEQAHEEKIKLSTSTTNIIMEGIRRLDEWPRIKEIFPNDRVVPRPAPVDKCDATVRFLEAEQAVLALVNGRRNLRDIVYLSNMEEFETLRLLMAFSLARCIEVPQGRTVEAREEEEDAEALSGLVGRYNRIFAQITGYLSSHLDPEEVGALMERGLETLESPILDGAHFDESGRLVANILTANVADLSAEKRMKALREGLDHLLSFVLFEASRHLGPTEKSDLYRQVGELSGSLA